MGRGEAVQYGGKTSLTRNAKGRTIVIEKKSPSPVHGFTDQHNVEFNVRTWAGSDSATQPNIQKQHTRPDYQAVQNPTSPVYQGQSNLNPSVDVGVRNIETKMSDSNNDNYLICDDLGGTGFDINVLPGRGMVQLQGDKSFLHQSPPVDGRNMVQLQGGKGLVHQSPPVEGRDMVQLQGGRALLHQSPPVTGRDMVQLQGGGALLHQSPPVEGRGKSQLPGNRGLPHHTQPVEGRDIVQLPSNRVLPHQTQPVAGRDMVQLQGGGALLHQSPPVEGRDKVQLPGNSGLPHNTQPVEEGRERVQLLGNRVLPHQTQPVEGRDMVQLQGGSALLHQSSPVEGRDKVQLPGNRALPHQTQPVEEGRERVKLPGNRALPHQTQPVEGRDMVQLQGGSALLHQSPPVQGRDKVKLPSSSALSHQTHSIEGRDMVQLQGSRALLHQTSPVQNKRQPLFPYSNTIFQRQFPQKEPANQSPTTSPSNFSSEKIKHTNQQERHTDVIFKDSTGQIWVAPSSEQEPESLKNYQENLRSPYNQGMGNWRNHPEQGSSSWRGHPDQGRGNWRSYQDQWPGNWRSNSNQGNWKNRDQRPDNWRPSNWEAGDWKSPSNQRPVNWNRQPDQRAWNSSPDQISTNKSPSKQGSGSSNWRSPDPQTSRRQSTQIIEPVSKPAALSADDMTLEQKKNEFEWQKFKVVRKIKKTLSTVEVEEIKLKAKEISDILDSEMSRLAPFPASWPKERHVALEEILDKSIQDEVFLPIAGPLMEELYVLKPESFKEILSDVLKRKEPEYVKVSSATNSDKLRSSYCSYLSSIMAGSDTGGEDSKFKEIVENIIMKLIQRWLYFDIKGEHLEMEEYLNVLGTCLAMLVKSLLPILVKDQKRKIFNLIKDKTLTSGPRKMKLNMLCLLLQWSSDWREDLFFSEYLDDPDTSGPFMKGSESKKPSTNNSSATKDIGSATVSSADCSDIRTSGSDVGSSSVEVKVSVIAKETIERSDKPAESEANSGANKTQVSNSLCASWWKEDMREEIAGKPGVNSNQVSDSSLAASWWEEDDMVDGNEGKPSCNTAHVSNTASSTSAWKEVDMVEGNGEKPGADKTQVANSASSGSWWEEENVLEGNSSQNADNTSAVTDAGKPMQPANASGNWWEEEQVVTTGADQTSDRGAIEARVVVPFMEVEGSSVGIGTCASTWEAGNKDQKQSDLAVNTDQNGSIPTEADEQSVVNNSTSVVSPTLQNIASQSLSNTSQNICQQGLERKIDPQQQLLKEADKNQGLNDVKSINQNKMTKTKQGRHSSLKQTKRKGSPNIKQFVLGCQFPSSDNDTDKSYNAHKEKATKNNEIKALDKKYVHHCREVCQDPPLGIVDTSAQKCSGVDTSGSTSKLQAILTPNIHGLPSTPVDNNEHPDVISVQDSENSEFESKSRIQFDLMPSISWTSSLFGKGFRKLVGTYLNSSSKDVLDSKEICTHSEDKSPPVDFGTSVDEGKELYAEERHQTGDRQSEGGNDVNGGLIQMQKSNLEAETEVVCISDLSTAQSQSTYTVNSSPTTVNSGPPSLSCLSSLSVTPESLPDLLKRETSSIKATDKSSEIKLRAMQSTHQETDANTATATLSTEPNSTETVDINEGDIDTEEKSYQIDRSRKKVKKKEKWHPFIYHNHDAINLLLTDETTESDDTNFVKSRQKSNRLLKPRQKSITNRQCYICRSREHSTKECHIHKKLDIKLEEKQKEAKEEVKKATTRNLVHKLVF
ncbi:uncharacterized protein LOC117124374 [Anneissia japonica]|uniref:uncharacterized protein LOC117124374 n=1 Tax=Anneissia japonica TaxID=1529436 RepID=UPI001425B329|nr:uncharacterized protein LOC117124374 [Anneissia japonica]